MVSFFEAFKRIPRFHLTQQTLQGRSPGKSWFIIRIHYRYNPTINPTVSQQSLDLKTSLVDYGAPPCIENSLFNLNGCSFQSTQKLLDIHYLEDHPTL